MFILYGARASKIAHTSLQGTTCQQCGAKDSYDLSTFSRYFHIFWIPFFPVHKVSIAECKNCKCSYKRVKFPPDLVRAFVVQQAKHKPSAPLWQASGCLGGLLLLVIISLVLLFTPGRSNKQYDPNDKYAINKQKFAADKLKMTSLINPKKDSIAARLKQCIDMLITSELSSDSYEYYTAINGHKLLVLMHVTNMKNVKPTARKQLVTAIEECLIGEVDKRITEKYICVEGKWNTLLVKTPTSADLDGRFANADLILPFYDSVTVKLDSIRKGKSYVY